MSPFLVDPDNGCAEWRAVNRTRNKSASGDGETYHRFFLAFFLSRFFAIENPDNKIID
jgi:hypothetical protein